MKNSFKFTYYILILLLTQFVLVSCSDNDDGYTDVDGLPPTIELTATAIKTEPGREFVIQGKVADKDGLASIQLVNKDLYLDKTINLKKDTITYEFELDYKFVSENDFEESDKFELKVIVTDLGGRTTEQTITITMDGDFTAPKFVLNPVEEVTVLIKPNTKFKLNLSVEDDKALDKVLISIPELSYSQEFTTFSNSKKFDYTEQISLPSSEAVYNLTITATDKAGLETEVSSIITVSEMPDFPKMYLVDVATVEEITNAVMGVPMLIERTAPYTYRARYYSEKSGSEVRFVPQKNDFEPICFGLDPDDSAKLTDDPEVSKPVVLADKGYYEITFNVQTASYTVNKYTPTDAYVPIGSNLDLDGSGQYIIPLEIGLIGSGFPNSMGDTPSNVLTLNQNQDNKYQFTVEINFTAPSEIKNFIIQTKHTWNWWPEPFWRWDRSEDPEANVPNGGDNGTVSVKKAGKYMVKFDSHLLRTQFYPIN